MWYWYLLTTVICFTLASWCGHGSLRRYKDNRKAARRDNDECMDLIIIMEAIFCVVYSVVGIVCFINMIWSINTGHGIPLP